MATPASATAYSVIYIGTLENNTNAGLRNNALGDQAQPSLEANNVGAFFFQPLFDPDSYSTDPVAGNRKQSFTFWRTDYLDRSFANTNIGGADETGAQGVLGDAADTAGLKPDGTVTWVQVGMKDPSSLLTQWRSYNDFTTVVRLSPLTSQVKRIRAAYNFACLVYGPEFTVDPDGTGEDDNDILPMRWGPLNLRNYAWGNVANSNGTTVGKGVYPGFRCGL